MECKWKPPQNPTQRRQQAIPLSTSASVGAPYLGTTSLSASSLSPEAVVNQVFDYASFLWEDPSLDLWHQPQELGPDLHNGLSFNDHHSSLVSCSILCFREEVPVPIHMRSNVLLNLCYDTASAYLIQPTVLVKLDPKLRNCCLTR